MNKPEVYVETNTLARREVKNALGMWEPLVWDVDGDVLDLGCGPGDVTIDLLRPNIPRFVDLRYRALFVFLIFRIRDV